MQVDHRRDAPPRSALDAEEIELLRVLSTGVPWSVVAHRLHMSERTAHRRTRQICESVGVGKPIEAVVWAIRHGFI
ncbi:hypothetical protein [Mumia sp. Pv 4-285]|uniref:hypothetical protein n=1 Tax=Mumia qirimensis TaxID=3234852 RepID=UPI00351CC574